jgi:glutathionyl-hydroquinone reductase
VTVTLTVCRFQLNEKYIRDYPHLWRWLQDFYSIPGVAAVSPVDQIKQGERYHARRRLR